MTLQAELRDIGRRHEGYGVKPYHFEAIEGAFIGRWNVCWAHHSRQR